MAEEQKVPLHRLSKFSSPDVARLVEHADALMQGNDSAGAIAAFRQALRLDPTNAEIRLRLAMV